MTEFRRVVDAGSTDPQFTSRAKELTLAYLDEGKVIQAGRGLAADRLDPTRPRAVPIYAATDGEWIWTGNTEYYLREHDIWPESGFVSAAVERDGHPPAVSDETAAQAGQWLRSSPA